MNDERNGIGSLIQVMARGPQDIPIHSEGSSFLFQTTYQQHTPFATHHERIQLKTVQCGNTTVVYIPKLADMIHRMYISVTLPQIYHGLLENDNQYPAIYKNYLAHLLLKNVAFKLNGETVSEYSGEYLWAQYSLSYPESKYNALSQMLGIRENDFDAQFDLQYSSFNPTTATSQLPIEFDSYVHRIYRRSQSLYIPLPLWDQHDIAQFFPCSPLYNQNIELHITFNSFDKLYILDSFTEYNGIPVSLNVSPSGHVNVIIGNTTIPHVYFHDTDSSFDNRGAIIPNDLFLPAHLDIDYIVLSNKERSTIVQNPQEYLYTFSSVQKERLTGDVNKIPLQFTTPVKQLIWFITYDEHLTNFHEPQFISFETGRLILGDDTNGILMNLQSAQYFQSLQSFYHNHRIQSDSRPIYSYSFSLNPQSGHNNGAIHFGKTPKKFLEINGPHLKDRYITIFALCYNVLSTQQGYGSVKFQ